MHFLNSIKMVLHLQRYSLADRSTWADATKCDKELRLKKVKPSMKPGFCHHEAGKKLWNKDSSATLEEKLLRINNFFLRSFQ